MNLKMHDKNNFIDKIRDNPGFYKLELGCGDRKLDDQSIGIDLIDSKNVDIVGNVFELLEILPESCLSGIYSSHFIEHIDDLELFFELTSKVLVKGAELKTVAPHFSNSWFYSDPTHKNFFGLYTMCYFSDCSLFSRKVPTYSHVINFSLKSVFLEFKSSRPFYVRHALRKILGFAINMSYYSMEFWEENLCNLISCYEVHYTLKKK